MCATAATAPSFFDADFGGAINLQTVDRKPNATDDELTAQTVRIIGMQAVMDAQSPIVQRATSQALQQAGIDSAAPDAHKCAAVWRFAKGKIRYVREAVLEGPFNLQLDRELDQTLIPPSVLLQMPDPKGDCPHFSALVASMLRVLGIGSSFKTIAADRTQPDAYSHIYNVAHTQQGDIPIDASNMDQPNTEYHGPVSKAKLWPIDGKRRPAPARLSGLGDTQFSPGSDGDFQDSTDYGNLTPTATPIGGYLNSDSGGGSGFDWSAFANNITKNIAAPILKAQYAVPNIPKGTTFQQRNADGSITQISSAPPGTASPFAGFGTASPGSSSTYLLIAAAAAVLFIVAKK